MASSKYASSHSDVRKEFKTKEGVYRIIKASEHCRPSKQPLFGKELTQVQVSFVSCKDRDGLHEWVLFNSGKELYFYPFEGVGKVRVTGEWIRAVCIFGISKVNHTHPPTHMMTFLTVWHSS